MQEGEDERTSADPGDIDQRDEDYWIQTFNSCGLPSNAGQELRFDIFSRRPGLEEAIEASETFVNRDGSIYFLTLAGPPGTGKTHLAAAIACEWLEGGRNAYFITVQDLLYRLRDTYDTGRRFMQELRRYQNIDLLVLDDLGMEKGTPWGLSILDGLIDYRYVNKKYLVVTTNALGQDLSPRIASRLRDKRRARIVKIDAPDYRSE